MNKVDFEVLCSFAGDRDLELVAKVFGYSSAQIAESMDTLKKNGLVVKNTITDKGRLALEPYKVKRAVFLAAGFGSRMVPITINTPKPLVRVHGKRIIETLIEAVRKAGIDEIYIVRGYLGEQFELLQKKYPMIKLIDNPEYDGTGTISSFYYARTFLEGAYVLESDLVVQNPTVIHKYHYSSDFLGTKTTQTDDWYLKTDVDGLINEIGVGSQGNNLFKLIGMSYWSPKDGHRLASDIEEAYKTPEGKKLPMSFVPFRVNKEKYAVSIMPCNEEDVVEIDSFSELQKYDETYKTK